jgi:polyisoprenoid-binding protein YceI
MFTSSKVRKENDLFWASGELTLAGTAKQVDIPFKFKNNHASGSFNLLRTDYKVGKIPGFVASKNVDVTFDITIE